mmetsp:Transcript_260/g.244  ORF Transcript_260/g.244 Transcript_260/m.244 type:complete len:369 (+) Transcript_260:301-1407(+)|eukprot:CAMPEP_0182416904 /NCGR_PEP_ID=MMETSP1167-20130531/1302_1 /TAXON_ID=2988 /ORGANISM="Mallomonas Sp, Strain CCMP3275" /LENGTH=368 /DNA_ID=CAMNT_0024590075 /DNA_START=210 /DNA_END=1316 /DNA_ORIENTATION=-
MEQKMDKSLLDLTNDIRTLADRIGFNVDDNEAHRLALQYPTAESAIEGYMTGVLSPVKSKVTQQRKVPEELKNCAEDSVAFTLWMMGFQPNDCLNAAKRCSTVASGVAYLSHGCGHDPPPIVKCCTCLDEHSMEKMVTLSCHPVPHRFCQDCFTEYCRIKINEAQVSPESLCCPEIGCKTPLTIDEIKANVTSKDFSKYEHFTLKRMCESQHWRPCPRCDWFADISQEDTDIDIWKSVQCGQCAHKFCGKCGEKPHRAQEDQDITCEKYSEWLASNSEGEKKFQELVSSSKWRRCPVCSCIAELSDGCKFIYCVCGKNFCYLCGVILTQSLHYSHYRGAPGCTGPYGEGCVGMGSVEEQKSADNDNSK